MAIATGWAFRGLLGAALAGAGGVDVAEIEFRPVRPAVLGFEIERQVDGDLHRLVRSDRRELPLASGTRDGCEEALVRAIEREHGRGLLNVPFPTMGARQLWADVFWYADWRIQRNALTGHHRLLDGRNIRRAWGSYAACRTVFEGRRLRRALRPTRGHLVVLVHGLGRSSGSFAKLEDELRAAGFSTAAVSYPSTRAPLAEHVERLEMLLDALEGAERVSFVTHSLGGLVARGVLAREGAWKRRIHPGKIVMLAPPSRGASMARLVQRVFPLRLLLGPSLRDIARLEDANLPAPSVPFGIIAAGRGRSDPGTADRARGGGWNPLIPGDDDGLVGVDEARLEGAADFLRVPGLHTFIMKDREVIRAVLRFLEAGRFGE